MSDDAVQLDRHRLAWLVVLATACSGAEAVPPATPTGCVASARDDKPSVALAICQREYEATRDPETGARLAEQLFRNRKVGDAKALATSLLASSSRATALRVLGWLALGEGRLDDAESALREAHDRHLARQMYVDVARDLIPLAGVLLKQDRFPELLRAYAECVAYASFTDRVVAGVCHLTAAETLVRLGHLDLAATELSYPEHMLTSDWHLTQYELARGNLMQELARQPLHPTEHKLAEGAFLAARVHAIAADFPSRVVAADLNLAYTLAELGRTSDAQRHLDAASRAGADLGAVSMLQANIEYHRNELDAAWSRNERIFPELTDDDDRIVVASLQARIALANGDSKAALQWSGLGIDAVERLRAHLPLEHRAWNLATRREPYELRFIAYARDGQPLKALLSIDGWQGRAARDAIATSRRGRGLVSAAEDAETLRRWLGAEAPPAPTTAPAVDLLVVLLADHKIWSVVSHQGKVQVHHLESMDPFKTKVARLIASPDDRELGAQLGAMLLRDGIARETSETLHVMVDGPLANLPIAALRVGARPIVALRPILRVTQLAAEPCDRPMREPSAVVLADPLGDLPAARGEARAVAAQLGAVPKLGEEATRAALFDAPPNALLHVAVHGDLTGGEVVHLRDGDVSALDLTTHARGPAVVVMPTCFSAAANDPEGSGSIAAAFLAVGSRRVVATQRTVTDDGAAAVMERFYREGGATNAVRALARAQAALAGSTNRDWASFDIYGHDVCPANQE